MHRTCLVIHFTFFISIFLPFSVLIFEMFISLFYGFHSFFCVFISFSFLSTSSHHKSFSTLLPHSLFSFSTSFSPLINCLINSFLMQFLSALSTLIPVFLSTCLQVYLSSSCHTFFKNSLTKVCLTLRLLMSYIYGAPILDVSRSHTTTQHSR